MSMTDDRVEEAKMYDKIRDLQRELAFVGKVVTDPDIAALVGEIKEKEEEYWEALEAYEGAQKAGTGKLTKRLEEMLEGERK